MQTHAKVIGDIRGTNNLRFKTDTNGMDMAMGLLSNQALGAPVVDSNGNFVGFVSELDLLRVAEAGKDLGEITAQDIMNRELQAVVEDTLLSDAVQLIRQKHLLNLPVVRNGVLTETVTRHDLLRAILGIDLGIETRR